MGAFVVQDLYDGFEAAIGEVLDELCEGLGELALAAGLHGLCKDRVRIVVVKNHDLLCAAAGGVRETTGLVAENLARNGHRFGGHTMGLCVDSINACSKE